MASEYRTTRRVEFADTDMAGIAHFASFFRYMEEAEHGLFRSLGMSIITCQEGVLLSWPRVRAACEYLGPARFEEVLDVRAAVDRIGAKSLTITAEFSSGDRLVARGAMTTVYCRFTEHAGLEPIPIPPEVRARLAGREETANDPKD